MSSLLGGDSSNTTATAPTGIDIQTSVQDVPIPLVWGKTRLAPNLIWYGDFGPGGLGKKGGKKSGKKGSNAAPNYQAALILAICEGSPVNGAEGPGIVGIGTVWQDKNVTTLAALGLTLFPGTAGQAAWSYLTTNHPTQALTYAYTAYLAAATYQLGKSPETPNHNVEVITPLSEAVIGTGWGVDANPADVIVDFLTNPQYSIGLSTSQLDVTGLTQYKAYCAAQWLMFSPCLDQQEQCSSVLDRWAKLTNTWIFWSGGLIKFVPLGDSVINPSTMGTVTESVLTSVPLTANYLGDFAFQGMPTVSANGGVVFQDTGGTLTQVFSTPTASGTYWVPTIGLWQFAPIDAGRPILVTYSRTYSSAASYTPNLTIQANLGYSDFISDKGDPPVEVTRTDPADAANHVKLDIKDRNNAYNSAVAEWQDQGLVDQFGRIDSAVTQATEICDPNVGQRCAQLIGQREAYIRNTYQFTVGWEYGSWLEPGDPITITEPHIGLNLFPVRIQTLDEDDQGNWKITAEEFPGIIGTIIAGGTQLNRSTQNTPVNYQAQPSNVNPPGVFEPSSNLTNGQAQLWISATGQTNWGGCNVYASFDGTNYTNIGVITLGGIQGVLTANLPDHADPDTTNTLSIDTTESDTALPNTATHADADAFRTLCLVTPTFTTVLPTNGEAMAYGAVSTTGAFTAALTYLRRALYGTSHSAHASGSYFTRFSPLGSAGTGIGAGGMLVYDLPAQYVGQTIYLKFCSFNELGNSIQSLASVTAYTYTPTGAGYGGGTNTTTGKTGVPTAPTGLTATGGAQQDDLTWNLNPATDNVLYYKVYRATGLSQPFSAATQIATSTTPNYIDPGLSAGATYTYFVVATNQVGDSNPSSGANATVGALGSLRYDIDSWMYGTQTVATQIVRLFTADRTVSIGTTGHVAKAKTGATSSATFTIYKNGSSVGTVNFAASGSSPQTGTVSISAAFTLSSGDTLEIDGPATPDGTLANVNIILAGVA